MKLSNDTIARLDQLIGTSMIAGIKKIIIEPGKIRGIDENQNVVVITTNSLPDFGGKQVGINRIDQLRSRIDLLRSADGPDLVVEAVESTTVADTIISLELSVGKTKVPFRCASVTAIANVPKNIVDKFVWEVTMPTKVLPVLTQGISTMGADHLTIASRDGISVSLECIDSNKDVFSTDGGSIRWIGDGAPDSSFCKKYVAKFLLPLLREVVKGQYSRGAPATDSIIIKLGQEGIISITVNDLSFYVLPVAG